MYVSGVGPSSIVRKLRVEFSDELDSYPGRETVKYWVKNLKRSDAPPWDFAAATPAER